MRRKGLRRLCLLFSAILVFNACYFTGYAEPSSNAASSSAASSSAASSSAASSSAATNSSEQQRIQQNINNYNNQLNQVNQNINNITNQKNQTQEQANELNAQIVDLMTSIKIAEKDLANKQNQLEQVKENLETAKQKVTEQNAAMRARIKSIYEKGNSGYLEVFLESKNLAELVNKMEYASTIYDYDKTMLENLKESKRQVEELEAQVEGEKLSIESAVQELNFEKSMLNSKLATLKKSISNYEVQIAKAQKDAEALTKKIEEENKKAAEALKNQTNGGSSGGGTSGGGTSGGGSDVQHNVPHNAALGAQVVAEAKKYVGNKYVWGGNDLNNGIDCSGFTQQIYGKFGFSLPRWSGDQRYCGTGIPFAEAQIGDLIYYAGHVAIYMGNNTIIHASNSAPYPQGGIKISSPATYMTIVSVRRLF